MNRDLALLLSDVYSNNLATDHMADLAKSGISGDTIRRHRIRTVPPAMIAVLLGFDIPTIRSAMLIPFPDPAGGFMDHVRIKVFPPLRSRGQHIKYLQPRASGTRLFFTLIKLPEVIGSRLPLWIVEGEKKALAVAQLGFPAVGFCGIEGWHRGGSTDLLADFDALNLDGRNVEVLPDGDWRTNFRVARGALRFARALRARRARVRLVLLPAGHSA